MTTCLARLAPAAAVIFVCAAGCAEMVTLSEPRSDAYLDAMAAAKRHHHAGRMRQAARGFGEAARAAERRVDREEARYRQAKALEEAGRLDEAVRVLDRIAARRPVARRTARALYDASVLRDRMGDPDGALRGWRRLLREHPTSGLASSSLKRILDHYEDRDARDRALQFVRRLYPDVSETELADDLLMAEAKLRLGRGDRAGARAVLERIVREHPYPEGGRWDNALWMLADMAVEDGRPRVAIRHLERMVRRRETTTLVGSYTLPTFPEAQLRIARIYRDALGDRERASRNFLELYEEYESSRLRDDALVEAGEMWIEAGLVERGCALLQRATREFDVGSARRRAQRLVRRRC